ncbi:MAG: family peptidase, partial [Candidatus Poribacteria bacterium]|nr:family peptidase [Candidatus Poribacteria bacterium]
MIAKNLFDEIDKIDITAILSDMVSMPSHETEQGVVEYIEKRLRKLGVEYEFTEVTPGRQNLIASIGDGKKSLILNSHTDTVSPGNIENWTDSPYKLTRKGDDLYGLGSCDAKGSLVAMLVAFEVLASKPSILKGRLILQAVCCEETRGRGTLAETAKGIKADAAIIGEPTELVPMIGHKGGLGVEVTVFGKPAHASSPEEGINAISNMARVIQALDTLAEDISKRRDPLIGKASLAITQINGGRATNVIPDQCVITIDRRLIPGETLKDAFDEISATIDNEKKANPSLVVSIEEKIGISPCSISPEESIVNTVKESIYQVTKKKREVTGFGACCDMWCLVEKANISTVILGPGKLSMAHKVNESVPINELYDAVKIYTTIALDW